jgi:deoxyhypusine monooxygenase
MAAAVGSLGSKLVDQSLGLPQRFRVLFSLRGVGTPDAADALLAGALHVLRATPAPAAGDLTSRSLRTALDDPSALCRHEVAFALGQMQARPPR